MKIAISCETTVDLPKEMIDKFDFKVVPFQIFLGEKNYLDGDITPSEIFDYVNKTNVLPKTGAVNQDQFKEHFSNILKEYDGIIHFSLSSEISSAYSNAVAVASKMKNVYVVDTRSLSTGIALLCLYADKLKKEKNDIETIYKKCLERVPYVQASFELNRLDYLYKGGRCSALAYFGANVLKLRPQIIVKDGKMIAGKKYRGSFDNVVKAYVRDTLEEFDNPDLTNVFITYTTANQEILENVTKTLHDYGFINVYLTTAGGTITSHCGENTLGILYINDCGNK